MQRKRKVGDDSSVKELPEKKRGRPLLLGDKLDGQVKSYIGYLREKGAAVNTAIVVGIAQGIVKSHNGNLLTCNGGHLVPWAKSLLSHMGYVKRRGSTAAKVTVENFQQLREQFLIDIKAVVEVEQNSYRSHNQLGSNRDQLPAHQYMDYGKRRHQKGGDHCCR